MRLNKYIALSTGLSRRGADEAIAENRVQLNGETVRQGRDITDADTVMLDDKIVSPPVSTTTIIFNKPRGYVVSRDGQGSQTVYDLLPPDLHELKPVGRLDKDSSGLLLLTNDGQLAQELTHPSRQKTKRYEITLDKPLAPLHRQMISDYGVTLEDGPSKLQLGRLHDGDDSTWEVVMTEGRNRQIRRTFASLGYDVTHLHRTGFGTYLLGSLALGEYTKS
jgi:23S rRNA pseudouridine2605 synthase